LKRVLADLNVVLDVVLDRKPHADWGLAFWTAARQKKVEVLVPAHGVTTLFYVTARARGRSFGRAAVSELLAVAKVASVDDAVLRRALALEWRDFEDAVCAAAAEAASCDLVVSRDPSGFERSPVVVVDPTTAVSMLRGGTGPDRVSEKRRHSRSLRR
jgi:predicted nucleic acid-binding protein